MENNYYHKRGIKPKDCAKVCVSLGLNPAYWNHLKAAFEILKVKYALS